MTLIENDSPKVHYTGPFVEGQLLPLTFPYIAKTDVYMLIDGAPAQLNIDFEIITEISAEHPVAYPNSAYIKNALPNAKQITLYRVTPLDQQAPFPQMSKFRSERIEQALDKLTMQQQEQEEQLSRCIIAPITLETFNGQLPAPAADQALKWNAEGTELENYDIIGEQEAFETEVNTKFEEQSTAIENRIDQFEEETNTQFSDFRNEINENLEAVLNAAEQLEKLDEAVQSTENAAEQANQSALSAQSSAQSAQDSYNNFKDSVDGALSTVNNTVQGAITTIDTKSSETIESITNIKTDAITDIESVADDEKEEIRELAEYIKDNAENIANRTSFAMFDTVVKDHLLTYEESKGLALQGTYVYKEAIAGSRYGYPDFYAKCLEERNTATATQVTLAGSTITMYVASNGHQYYDIANKGVVDNFFGTMGSAWFYGVDTAEEKIFLPRNNFFEQMTGNVAEVGDSVQAGLPNITGQTALKHGSRVPGFDSFSGAIQAYDIARGGDSNAYVGNQTPFGFNIDASRSSAVYGRSSTVQPNAVKKLLYICVGNTVADTSWVDVVTQVEGGVKDIEEKRVQALTDLTNKENAGISALANASNALRTTQITNCLLEVPQRIKLELNNGILTLKAGSEVIVPNGFEADGTTPKFDYVTVESDVLFDFSSWGTTKRTLTFNTVQQKLEGFERETQTSSGSAVPAVEYGYMTWYDTANNLVKYSSDSGTTWSAGGSLPLAIFSGGDSVLDQVFNGFGYIGSTIWVDKGVKGLISNGRNEDGTLNNIEYITQNVTLKTQNVSGWNGRWTAYLGNDGYVDTHPTELHYISEVKPAVWTQTAYWENPAENKLYLTVDTGATWNQVLQINIAKFIESNTKIQKLQHKNSFRAVDYSDYVNRLHIVETYVNGASWYRVWSDGWKEQGGALHNLATGNDGIVTVSYLKPFSNGSYTLVTNVGWDAATNQSAWQQPYAKTATGFSYRKDSRYIGNWYACGY